MPRQKKSATKPIATKALQRYYRARDQFNDELHYFANSVLRGAVDEVRQSGKFTADIEETIETHTRAAKKLHELPRRWLLRGKFETVSEATLDRMDAIMELDLRIEAELGDSTEPGQTS